MAYRLSLHLKVVAIEKETFRLPSTKVANFTYLLIYTHYHHGPIGIILMIRLDET